MIYHFNLAYLDGMSGGDKCTLEVVRYLVSQKIKNTLITTYAGRDQFIAQGLAENSFCKYIVVPDCEPCEKGFEILIAYIKRTFEAYRLMNTIGVNDDDCFFCHNEFFPNIIPFTRLAKLHPTAKLIYHIHMIAPDLWKGYQGHFTGEINLPDLRLIRYRLEQWFFKKKVFQRALVLYNNSYYDDILARWFPENERHNIAKYSGVEVSQISSGEKKYDLVWCGRFHVQKGLEEIPEIIAKLKRHKPNIKLAIIGSGDHAKKKLLRKIKKYNLRHNIELKGFLEGAKKFSVMKSSKVFLMTSYFESFGQVNLEAMKCGLPVVAYDLPVFEVFDKGMIRVPIKDNEKMALEIRHLLDNPEYYLQASQEAESFAKEFSWEKTGREIYDVITEK